MRSTMRVSTFMWGEGIPAAGTRGMITMLRKNTMIAMILLGAISPENRGIRAKTTPMRTNTNMNARVSLKKKLSSSVISPGSGCSRRG